MRLFPLLLALSLPAFSAPLKLVTFNVENLFDWTHDAGKEDYTYLPVAVKNRSREVQAYCARQPSAFKRDCFELDWTEAVVRAKARGLATFLMGTFPQGPDVVVTQEVENLNVLTILAAAMGPAYKAILLEGPDERGIDVGVITRLPVLHQQLRPIVLADGDHTRGILRVDVNHGNQRVSVLANHWPSQGNPDEDRMTAAQTLATFAQETAQQSNAVIAAGDFNTAPDDVLDGIQEVLLPLFWDAEAEARRMGVALFDGTYNYKGRWQSLDHIFIMKGGRVPAWNSVFIPFEGMLETRMFNGQLEQHPRRYNPRTGEGLSDHLPMKMEIAL